jgi:addiction module RelE/StbE family toxin
MRIEYSSRFLRLVKKLPAQEQRAVFDAIERFETNPKDSRLRAHKLHGTLAGLYAIAVRYNLRAVFGTKGDAVIFFDIGSHDEVY